MHYKGILRNMFVIFTEGQFKSNSYPLLEILRLEKLAVVAEILVSNIEPLSLSTHYSSLVLQNSMCSLNVGITNAFLLCELCTSLYVNAENAYVQPTLNKVIHKQVIYNSSIVNYLVIMMVKILFILSHIPFSDTNNVNNREEKKVVNLSPQDLLL